MFFSSSLTSSEDFIKFNFNWFLFQLMFFLILWFRIFIEILWLKFRYFVHTLPTRPAWWKFGLKTSNWVLSTLCLEYIFHFSVCTYTNKNNLLDLIKVQQVKFCIFSQQAPEVGMKMQKEPGWNRSQEPIAAW